MATKTKTSKAAAYALDAGVGVELSPRKSGFGVERTPHIAVSHHPLHGIQAHGPFLDEDAARKWIHLHGADEIIHMYGTDELPNIKWYAMFLCVPTHATGKDE